MLAHSNVVQAASLTRVPSLSCAVAFDTGYAGSNGLEPQSWVNGNGTSYIYFGSGEFDGQGSGHDFSGTVSRGAFRATACLFAAHGSPRSCVPESHQSGVLASHNLPRCPRLSILLTLCMFEQLYMPPSGYINSCDGGRSHTYCDYRQQ